MSVIGSNILAGASGQAVGYQVERSLRFNSSDSAYCSRVPSTAGNRKTWTWSGWVKRAALGGDQALFNGGATGSDRAGINITSDSINFYDVTSTSVSFQLLTTAKLRDPSAWYHIVATLDTSQTTSSNRAKVWVNGVEVTAFATANYPAQNAQPNINAAVSHTIGTNPANEYFSGYLADIHFIDGQALTPSSFAETNSVTGQWVPKAYTNTYGTNGFKLTFSDNSNTTATTLGKDTSGNNNHWSPVNLSINTGGPTSVAAASGALPIYNTTDTYGATKGTGTRTDANGGSLVLAIPMDGANNGTTFTDESATIRGSGSAKTITPTGDAKTSTAQSKYYGSSAYFDGTVDSLTVATSTDLSFGSGDFCIEWWFYPSSSITSGPTIWSQGNTASNYFNIHYNISSSNKLQVFIDPITSSTFILEGLAPRDQWTHVAVTRSGSTLRLFMNGIQSGSYTSSNSITLNSYALSIAGAGYIGYLQDLRVYKGVAKYTGGFNPPSTTQNPTVAAGNDSLVDTPTSYGTDTGAGGDVRGNYCTWNPLDAGATPTLSNGNLDITTPSASGYHATRGTIAVSAGKWYFEFVSSTSETLVGIMPMSEAPNTFPGNTANSYGLYFSSGNFYKFNNGSSTLMSTGSTSDVQGIALDLNAGTITYYKNGTSIGSFTGLNTSLIYAPAIADGVSGGTASGTANFGQRPFAYTAPSGFKALCDTNLPAPVVAKPSEVMDVKLYTGNGSTQTISGLGFSPDFIWTKSRSRIDNNVLHDIVRGRTSNLYSDLAASENTTTTSTADLVSFDANGYTLGTVQQSAMNRSGETYVAWTWDAGTSTVTNTQGSITSSVRANASAGFSIVTYTGTGANATVGHGLGVAPQLVIVKGRGTTFGWTVWHQAFAATSLINLNLTSAVSTGQTTTWNSTTPTSTVFSIGTALAVNSNGSGYVAYCFAPVAGYSAFGSYVGNGSTDGPFVFTGHRSRFILLKRTDAAADWYIFDAARNSYNALTSILLPNAPDAELTNNLYAQDIVANGWKIRSSQSAFNASGGTYLYASFAEFPFQYARAR